MDLDFSTMVESLTYASLVTAMVSFGVVQLFPTFTMWAVDKVAGFFGYDPYDRDNKHED